MGSLIAQALNSPLLPTGLAADSTPSVPSTPVQIGTPGADHGVPEAGSWRLLLVMLAAVIILGVAVLMVVVRQRARALARRRVRRTAEAVAALAEYESLGELGQPPARPGPSHATAHPIPHYSRHSEPRGPERVT